MVDINKRLVEVDVILNHLSQENYQKIPKEIIQVIKKNMDKDYIWEYDKSKELEDQDVSRDTIAFLSYINMEYLLDEKQKEYMEKLYESNERKLEEEKAKQYSVDDIFKRKSIEKEQIQNIEEKQENALVVYKENFFKKIFTKIKNFFKLTKMNE